MSNDTQHKEVLRDEIVAMMEIIQADLREATEEVLNIDVDAKTNVWGTFKRVQKAKEKAHQMKSQIKSIVKFD